jgi:L-iditol 2-dehydrogenase
MKAFRRHARRERAASLVEVPVPEPEKNQVLLKVSHCGVCGSDLHAWLNHPGYESVLPEVTFGHELSGSVVSTGPNAGDWKEGDRAVMIALQTSHDPNDRYCVDGLPQLSHRRRVQGLHLDGGMAEYVCVDSEFLIPVPDGLDPALAALTEPLSVAEHCIGNRSSVGPGDRVVVSGPGIIGMFCALSARSRGAEVLISGTERDEPSRLQAARRIGFETLIVGPDKRSLAEQVEEHFTDGADALIEASGAAPALSEAWQSVRPDGTITAVALYSRTIDFDLTQFLRKQIDLRTSYASSKDDYLRAFKLLQDGSVDASVLTQGYSLADAEQGFVDSENLAVTKVLLDCT